MFKTALLLLFLLGCSIEHRPAAPLSDYAALEKLATSFRELSDLNPQAPSVLPMDERKVFVERVFKHAGYDYARTLQALAENEIHTWDRQQHDLIELVLFPHHGNAHQSEFANIYSAQELNNVLLLQQAVERANTPSPLR